mgnify:CR=1 FL=1
MDAASKPPQPARVCFTSPWVDVVAVPSGNGSAEEHLVVRAHDYVSIVAVLPDGRVLLVRQYRPAVNGETLELPAGHVERDQTPEDAARQELLEETGYRAGGVQPLGVLHPDTGRMGNRHFVFFASDLEKVAEPLEHEGTVPLAVTPAELVAMMLDEIGRAHV